MTVTLGEWIDTEGQHPIELQSRLVAASPADEETRAVLSRRRQTAPVSSIAAFL